MKLWRLKTSNLAKGGNPDRKHWPVRTAGRQRAMDKTNSEVIIPGGKPARLGNPSFKEASPTNFGGGQLLLKNRKFRSTSSVTTSLSVKVTC